MSMTIQNLPDLYIAFPHILKSQSPQISRRIFNICPWLEPWIAGDNKKEPINHYIEIKFIS